MTKLNIKNQLGSHFSDIIVITSSKNVTKLNLPGFSICLSPSPHPIKIFDYTCVLVSLDKTLCDDYLCLVTLNKQQIN